jgi:hypothetical protein
MTRDPRRLLDDPSEMHPDALRALEAGLDEGVPPGAKAAVWGALATALPKAAAAAAATAASGAAATTATVTAGVSFMKLGAIGVALGTLSSVGFFAIGRVTTPKPAPAPHVASVSPRASAPATPQATVNGNLVAEPSLAEPAVEPPAREPAAAARPADTAPDAPRTSDALLEESKRVANARSLLRQGSAADALSALVAIERELPNGMLSQEREALIIEALSALGHRELVRQRAARFLGRYPASPHAEAVRRASE